MKRTKVIDGVRVPLTAEEEIARDMEEAAVAVEAAENDYKVKRRAQYLSAEDYLDMIYWDEVNKTNKFIEHKAKVKRDNPKPNI